MTAAGPEQTAEQPAVPAGSTSPARIHEAGTTSTTGTAGSEQPGGATGAALSPGGADRESPGATGAAGPQEPSACPAGAAGAADSASAGTASAAGAAIADQSGGSPGPASTAGSAQARGCSRASCPAVADQPSARSAVLSGARRTGGTIADQRAVGERLEGGVDCVQHI